MEDPSSKPAAEQAELPSAAKLPYEPPRITFVEHLEAVAAVCAPPNGKATPGVCFIGSS